MAKQSKGTFRIAAMTNDFIAAFRERLALTDRPQEEVWAALVIAVSEILENDPGLIDTFHQKLKMVSDFEREAQERKRNENA